MHPGLRQLSWPNSASSQQLNAPALMPVGIAAALQNETSATIQVRIDDGVCVEATLANVKKADGLQFKAKTP